MHLAWDSLPQAFLTTLSNSLFPMTPGSCLKHNCSVTTWSVIEDRLWKLPAPHFTGVSTLFILTDNKAAIVPQVRRHLPLQVIHTRKMCFSCLQQKQGVNSAYLPAMFLSQFFKQIIFDRNTHWSFTLNFSPRLPNTCLGNYIRIDIVRP